jgi:hypothetical protein
MIYARYSEGHIPTKEYSAYCRMRGRHYNNHGIYDLWLTTEGFHNFMDHVGYAPTNMHQLDRIDNNKGYFPGNLRWATVSQQNRNKSDTHNITFQGRTQCMQAWADEFGMSINTLSSRINTYSWPVENALTVPVRSTAE